VHEEEADQSERTDEVDRPRRLPSAQHLGQPRHPGIGGGRHGKAGHDHQRDQHEQHRGISELLQHVIAQRRHAGGETQPGMLFDIVPDMRGPPLAGGDVNIAAQVPVDQRPQQIKQQAQRERPCERQMPQPCVGQAVV